MSIADVIRLQPYWTFNDVNKLAINVEKQQQRDVKKSNSSSYKRPNYPNQGSSNIGGGNSKAFNKANSPNSPNSKVEEKKPQEDAMR